MSNIIKLNQSTENSAEQKGNSENAIHQLQELVAKDMQIVNETILNRMKSPVVLIPELAGHLISSGGKRLRPMLTLACAKLVGYEGERHTKLATCVEFIHTATLLHDDVVDESHLRRGKKTANDVWGNKPSVLVGDFLFSRSFELMVEDGSLKVLKILSSASSVIAEGEVLQLTTTRDLTTSEDSYLEVIKAKTAALFAAACQISAVAAERNEKEEEALKSYGMNLGIAFQLIDDALDYSAKQATLGKAIGDDFREGKITLPLILASRRGDEDEKQFWKKTVGKLKQDEGDLEHAIELMKKHDSITATIERARFYGLKAKEDLAIFSNQHCRQILENIVDFCINRAY